MTDNELKALVAGLAVAQDRTEALLAETAALQAKNEAKHEDYLAKTEALLAETAALQAKREAKQSRTEANLAKTEALLAETAALQAKNEARTEANLAKTEALLAETAALQAENEAKQAKYDARVDKMAAKVDKMAAKVDKMAAKVDKMAEMYGGVSNNLGSVAEEFYHNSLKADPVLAGVRFDFIDKNAKRSGGGVEDEFDLLLVNGSEACVVEVKHKAHESDLERLLNKKAPNFRRLFPEYAGRRQWLALAAFHIHDDLKKAALAQGVTVLQRKGDVFETLPA